MRGLLFHCVSHVVGQRVNHSEHQLGPVKKRCSIADPLEPSKVKVKSTAWISDRKSSPALTRASQARILVRRRPPCH